MGVLLSELAQTSVLWGIDFGSEVEASSGRGDVNIIHALTAPNRVPMVSGPAATKKLRPDRESLSLVGGGARWEK